MEAYAPITVVFLTRFSRSHQGPLSSRGNVDVDRHQILKPVGSDDPLLTDNHIVDTLGGLLTGVEGWNIVRAQQGSHGLSVVGGSFPR